MEDDIAATQEGARDFWRLVIGFFLPPVGVFLQVGLGVHFWLNLLLTVFLFGIGGQIHAAWVIATIGEGGRADEDGTRKFVAVLLSYYLPPVGVALKAGVGLGLVLNIFLSILGWIPGVLHALWLITTDD